MAIETRKSQPDDSSFIIACWLNHYKNHSYFAKRIRSNIYYPWQEMIIKAILGRPNTEALVAVESSEPEVILGYMVYESQEPVIHFTYVKKPFRRFGIAKLLFQRSNLTEDRLIFTHWTFDMDHLITKFPMLTYNPYKI